MKLIDRINVECEHIIYPDLLVMNTNMVAQLMDELSEEYQTNIDLDNAYDFLGMDIVISDRLKDDYRLARFTNVIL